MYNRISKSFIISNNKKNGKIKKKMAKLKIIIKKIKNPATYIGSDTVRDLHPILNVECALAERPAKRAPREAG